jgi:hypothetical protein
MSITCIEWLDNGCPQLYWEWGVQGSAESEVSAETYFNGHVEEVNYK